MNPKRRQDFSPLDEFEHEGPRPTEQRSIRARRSLSFCGEPIVFRTGSAEVLGKSERTDDRVILELAHVDGGGEGALPALGALASRYAAREKLAFLEWRVHAVHCANPNPKLRRVLEHRGFKSKEVGGVGECYYLVQAVSGFKQNHGAEV